MNTRSQITTHILDLGSGQPAAGVSVSLEQQTDTGWHSLASAMTDADGRIFNAFPPEVDAGTYRLTFDTQGYFQHQGKRCFYPSVTIVFCLDDADAHYHVPLLLNQWGYSTYRGS
ncbi:hydroxyisourate hydrolase [Halopseudomonas pelagia]|uniref:hydroxyisourate hydrolase n=1 Tax=Halopseudomonas pelagia TaxID=553151 RepID=UPI0003A48AC7|nr:hydroxyisourate hydrolase [Halopseudomonas pelagia]